MKVVICGGGIAGLTLAWWLNRDGHQAVIVEKAPGPRGGGYMIDFFGSGYDVAEKMGLLGELAEAHYPVPCLTFLAPDGREKFSISYPRLRKLFANRHFNFMRGDLERVLDSALGGRATVRYATTVRAFEQHADGVRVSLSDGTTCAADLLVGADGVHSQVRRLAFGGDTDFERPLGYRTAAFILDEFDRSWVPAGDFRMLAEPGRFVGIYPVRGGRLATFFVHETRGPAHDFSLAAARAELRAVYGSMRWVVPQLLEASERVGEIYFDEVSQIEMPHWSAGRVALVGDACGCVSLMAGQGASLAMAGGYVLAEELAKGDVAAAVGRYERRLAAKVREKQRAGRRIARWFVPSSRWRLFLFCMGMRVAAWPLVSGLLSRWMASESIFDR